MRVILACLISILFSSKLSAQIVQQWESPSTYGYKALVNDYGSDQYPFYSINDTLNLQCRFYAIENFALTYTLPLQSTTEYVFGMVPDMNNNGHPEVVFTNYSLPGYKARIVDASTGAQIFAWSDPSYSYYLWHMYRTTGSNLLRAALIKTSVSTLASTMVVYSLGISVDVEETGGGVPADMNLHQNFPNPFNPDTRIRYDLAESGSPAIEVFDIGGRLIRTIAPGYQNAGSHDVRWDGKDESGRQVPSGPYFYRLRSGGTVQTKKMIVLR